MSVPSLKPLFTVYQLIASDLDGTLLDADHMVSPYTARTLQRLQQQGVHIVIATGRHFLDVSGIRAACGVKAHLITSNGARVHDPDDRLIVQRNLDPALARQLTNPRYAAGTLLNFYRDDGWLIDQPCQWLLDMHRESGFGYTVCNLAEHPGDGVAKVLYVGEHPHLLEVEARLLEDFGDRITVTFSAEDCLEVMAPGVTKGSALSLVLDRLQIHRARCVAFGDGQNDLEMLQVAGQPRLMANAHPRLVTELPDAPRIGSNREQGVARHLRALFGLDIED